MSGRYNIIKQFFTKSGDGKAIKSVKTNVPDTKLKKLQAANTIAKQRLKGAEAKLKQTNFELANKDFKKDDKFTFQKSNKKSESRKERYKRIQKENTESIKKMIDTAFAENKAKGGRVGLKGGGNLGMQSVKYGLDNNPKITAADPKAKFIAANKKKKNKTPIQKAVRKDKKKKRFV